MKSQILLLDPNSFASNHRYEGRIFQVRTVCFDIGSNLNDRINQQALIPRLDRTDAVY